MEALHKLSENRKVGVGVGTAILILAMGILGLQLFGSSGNVPAGATRAFYTDDNGKTFFKDDVNKVSPFDHNGKQAYRADVFQDVDGKQFVGLVYRYTPAGRREIENFMAKKAKDPDGSLRRSIEQRGMQVQRAGGDGPWAQPDEQAIERLQASIKGPTGKQAALIAP
jgi:hypothetical protein